MVDGVYWNFDFAQGIFQPTFISYGPKVYLYKTNNCTSTKYASYIEVTYGVNDFYPLPGYTFQWQSATDTEIYKLTVVRDATAYTGIKSYATGTYGGQQISIGQDVWGLGFTDAVSYSASCRTLDGTTTRATALTAAIADNTTNGGGEPFKISTNKINLYSTLYQLDLVSVPAAMADWNLTVIN